MRSVLCGVRLLLRSAFRELPCGVLGMSSSACECHWARGCRMIRDSLPCVWARLWCGSICDCEMDICGLLCRVRCPRRACGFGLLAAGHEAHMPPEARQVRIRLVRHTLCEGGRSQCFSLGSLVRVVLVS